jgi:hypothetical protein
MKAIKPEEARKKWLSSSRQKVVVWEGSKNVLGQLKGDPYNHTNYN